MQALGEILSGLGMSQYLGSFKEEGFDSWDTILDITESDLDALGVKLGHRRKLQRRIAETRGIAPHAVLPSTIRQNNKETKLDSSRPMTNGPESVLAREGVVAKRKYRRHPKPDRNAPERPPSAYVLFSNKIREGLKGQTLSFTDIAKLVGERWKTLPHAEKEDLETQARKAKEKYSGELAKYKKTPEYQKYSRYLQEFKKKQQKSSKGQAKYPQRSVEALSPSRQSTLVGNDAWRQQNSGPAQSHRGSIDDAAHRSGRRSISIGSNGIGGGSAYPTRGTSPSSPGPRRSGSPDASVECLSCSGSWIISPGGGAVAKNVPLSPRATTGDGSPGQEVPASRYIETASQQALPSLSDIFDNGMSAPRLDRLELGPHMGGRYSRNRNWVLEPAMPTTGAFAVRRGTWPTTGGSPSPELYSSTDTGPAKDAGLPIRSLLSNNLPPPTHQPALCVSNNYH